MRMNQMHLIFDAKSVNESFARVAVAAFLTELNPTLDEIADVKTAVSEAVTNAVIHAYESDAEQIDIRCRTSCDTSGKMFEVIVKDTGKGIADIERAMEPFYTTKPELERSGMGFAFMEAFMDELEVVSKINEGTTIVMRKYIGKQDDLLCAISQSL